MTTDTRDEEPLAWCPGCGDRIPTEVIRERGVCSNCYGTSDDPWVTARAEAWDEGYQDGLRQGGEGEDGPRYVNPYRAAGRAETTPDEECGDYPAPCNCDDPETHDGAVTAADARAEAERRWPHGKCLDPLLYGLMKDKQRVFIEGAEWAAARLAAVAHRTDEENDR